MGMIAYGEYPMVRRSSLTKKQKKRVTHKDIAAKLGLTSAAVSYAMNGRSGVSENVAEKIRTTAKEMGYRPNRIATATRTGRTQTLGLMLPDLTNPFFPLLAQGAQYAAYKAGYTLFLFDAHNKQVLETEGLDRFLSYSVDGILWCPTSDRAIVDHPVDCPMVIIDRPVAGFDSVYADADGGGRLQAEYIYEMGHQKIGILSGPSRSPSAYSRKSALRLTLPLSIEVLWEFELDYTTIIPEIVIKQVAKKDVTCIVCANDTIAIGLMKILRDLHICVPHDISVIGYDNISWSELVTPSLTTINIPIEQLGVSAVQLAMERIQSPNAPTKEIKLDISLIERSSVAKRTKN